jgi:FlaA1/EpsC-like NDP-sugar epimerase
MYGTRGKSTVSASVLLNREVLPVYGPEAQLIVEDQTVLVTGAGGSIGSEIVRQLIHLGAGRVVCVDNDEYALYCLELDLRGSALLTDENFILADITCATELARIFVQFQPALVFHAAARKQLPLLEKSPAAAIMTNVMGTYLVAKACVDYGVKRFVNISTDKAARPTSILGMTKRLAEMVAMHFAGGTTKIASVRFGNVFGSRGSFVETFIYQIAHDLPVTVTDRASTRYFMTIPEAAGLVIEAAWQANQGDTFVLDMGESYAIVDLIHRYAALTHTQPAINYTGLRQGEKLNEELFDPSETRQPTRHTAITAVSVNGNIVPLDLILSLTTLVASPAELRNTLETLLNTVSLTVGV